MELPYWDIEHFKTDLKLRYDSCSQYRPSQTRVISLEGRLDRGASYKNFSYELHSETFKLFLNGKNEKKLFGLFSCTYPDDSGEMSLHCEETCMGCFEEQPNQLAHMDYGGCLYQEDEISLLDPSLR
jgi:hypothetical protein